MSDVADPTTHLTVRGPEDLLALIPHQLGYRPREGAVLFLPLTSGGGLCLSMNPVQEGQDPAEMAAPLRAALAEVAHQGVAAVVCYGTTGRDLLVRQTEKIAVVLTSAGFEILTELCVDTGRQQWWDVQQPEHTRGLTEVEDSVLNAHLVSLGSSVATHVPGDDPHVPPVFRDRAALLREALLRECRSESSGATTTSPVTATKPVEDVPLTVSDLVMAWDHALGAVTDNPGSWWAVLLALDDDHLLELARGMRHGPLRDALVHGWITGSPERAVTAHAGIDAALRTARQRSATGSLSGRPLGDRGAVDPEAVHEALCCSRVVTGEWEGRPDWSALDAAYRVLSGLDHLYTALGASWPCQEHGASCPHVGPVHADVVSAMAQVEIFRGRGHTAARLLQRCQRISPGRESAAVVLYRLETFDLPWWVSDARTAWHGPRG